MKQIHHLKLLAQLAGYPLASLCKCLIALGVLAVSQFDTQAAKILYHQNLGQRDTAKFVDLLVAQGHDVTVINEQGGETLSTAVVYAGQGYHLLIVDEVVGSGSVGTRFKDSPIPVISAEAFLLRSDRLSFCSGTGPNSYASVGAAQAASATGGQILPETSINITAVGHPLAAGLSGTVQIFNTSIDTNVYPIPPENPGPARFQGVVTFASAANNLVAGVTKIAEMPGEPNYYSLFVVEPGVINAGGLTTNQARYIHLPWNISLDGRVLQEPSYLLFEAAVAYALGSNQPTKIRDLTESTVFAPTNKVISFKVDKTTAAGSAVSTSGITMAVNGVNVSSSLVITDGGSTWNASYTNGFATNGVYSVIVSATAANNGFSARKMTFDTLGDSFFTVEAEHYNFRETNTFNAGQFYQSPVLCQSIGGGTLDCYFDEISSNGVDRVKNNARQTAALPYNVEIYRFGHSFTREENMDTYVGLDFTTQARAANVAAGIPDYDLRSITLNDWQNYTRTYPTGTFNVYLRMVSSKTNGTVRLDLVNDPVIPTATNSLGTFISRGIGPQTVRLTDSGGVTPIVVALTNQSPSTLRLTELSAGFHMQGYFVLVPTTAAVDLPPSISITNPVDRSLLSEGVGTTINVTVTDDNGVTNVVFKANNVQFAQDNTAPYSATFTPAVLGAVDTAYTIEATAYDTGGLSASTSIKVNAIDPTLTVVKTSAGNGTDAGVNENNGADGGPANGDSMSIRFNDPANNEIGVLRFDLTGYTPAQLSDVSFTVVDYRDGSGQTMQLYGVPPSATNTGGLFNINEWAETNVTFSTMPGLIYDASGSTPGVDTNSVILLGSVTPTGAKEKRLTISGAALLSFLQTGASNNLVTFILAKDLAAGSSSGLNLMATKEATTLRDGTPVSPTGSAGFWAPFLSFHVSAAPPTLNYAVSGNNLQFNWTGSFKLIAKTNSLSIGLTNGSGWHLYPGGGTSPVNVPIDKAQGTVFFGLTP